jgi:hypothetical protein
MAMLLACPRFFNSSALTTQIRRKNTKKIRKKKLPKNSDSSPQKLSDLTRLLASRNSYRKISPPLLFTAASSSQEEREREMGGAHDCENLGFCLPAP